MRRRSQLHRQRYRYANRKIVQKDIFETISVQILEKNVNNGNILTQANFLTACKARNIPVVNFMIQRGFILPEGEFLELFLSGKYKRYLTYINKYNNIRYLSTYTRTKFTFLNNEMHLIELMNNYFIKGIPKTLSVSLTELLNSIALILIFRQKLDLIKYAKNKLKLHISIPFISNILHYLITKLIMEDNVDMIDFIINNCDELSYAYICNKDYCDLAFIKSPKMLDILINKYGMFCSKNIIKKISEWTINTIKKLEKINYPLELVLDKILLYGNDIAIDYVIDTLPFNTQLYVLLLVHNRFDKANLLIEKNILTVSPDILMQLYMQNINKHIIDRKIIKTLQLLESKGCNLMNQMLGTQLIKNNKIISLQFLYNHHCIVVPLSEIKKCYTKTLNIQLLRYCNVIHGKSLIDLLTDSQKVVCIINQLKNNKWTNERMLPLIKNIKVIPNKQIYAILKYITVNPKCHYNNIHSQKPVMTKKGKVLIENIFKYIPLTNKNIMFISLHSEHFIEPEKKNKCITIREYHKFIHNNLLYKKGLSTNLIINALKLGIKITPYTIELICDNGKKNGRINSKLYRYRIGHNKNMIRILLIVNKMGKMTHNVSNYLGYYWILRTVKRVTYTPKKNEIFK